MQKTYTFTLDNSRNDGKRYAANCWITGLFNYGLAFRVEREMASSVVEKITVTITNCTDYTPFIEEVPEMILNAWDDMTVQERKHMIRVFLMTPRKEIDYWVK